MVRAVTRDLVLRLLRTRPHGVTLELDLGADDPHDVTGDAPGFGVPAHVVADLEASCHVHGDGRFFLSRCRELFPRIAEPANTILPTSSCTHDARMSRADVTS